MTLTEDERWWEWYFSTPPQKRIVADIEARNRLAFLENADEIGQHIQDQARNTENPNG